MTDIWPLLVLLVATAGGLLCAIGMNLYLVWKDTRRKK